MYGYPAAAVAAPAGAAYPAGQFPVAAAHHGAEGAAGAAAAAPAGAAGEMMVQTPYGMAPYSYMSFQGVPYAQAQQGYPVRDKAVWESKAWRAVLSLL